MRHNPTLGLSMNNQSLPPIYVIEITRFGESDIRLLTEVERTAMGTMDLEAFELWKHDGRKRFWASSFTSEEMRKHGFSMKDKYSKNHGCHETDFVALGNGVYEEYEVGFDQADALIRRFGSFLYFLPQYFWGSNGCEVLPPTSDFDHGSFVLRQFDRQQRTCGVIGYIRC